MTKSVVSQLKVFLFPLHLSSTPLTLSLSFSQLTVNRHLTSQVYLVAATTNLVYPTATTPHCRRQHSVATHFKFMNLNLVYPLADVLKAELLASQVEEYSTT